MGTINYSVIIPHKNNLPLLERCVNSIPERNDIQVIVVDDNSDSTIADFNYFPDSNRKNIEIYLTKEGKGAGYARNIGLKHAIGEWLIFADADDFFYPNAFDVIDNYLKGKKIDVIYFYADSRDGITGELIQDRVPNIKSAIDAKDYNRLRYKSYVPWGKVVNRKIVVDNNIVFEEIEVSNDVMFSTMVGYYSKNVGTINEPLYCCTQNANSLEFKRTHKRTQIRLEAANRVNEFLFEKGLLKKYRFNVSYRLFLFLPNHPIMFVSYLIKCRYKGHTLLYINDIVNKCKFLVKRKIRKYR